MARHFDSSHSVLTHAGFSFVVVLFAVIAAAACGRAGTGDPYGRAIRRVGTGIFVVLFVQFLLGWVALWATQTGDSARPIPLAGELAEAHPLPVGEALVTTAHQTGGALLIAAVALALFWARRAGRIARNA